MAKNPLGKIKDAAVESLKAPAAVAGSAVGLVKGAAATGGQVTKSAADALTSLVGGGKGDGSAAGSEEVGPGRGSPAADVEKTAASGEPAAAPKKPKATKATVKTGSKPVNVTKELGLDPVPVEEPKPAKKTARQKAVTSIDAAADPSSVDVTPADVASVISGEHSGGGSTS